MNALSRWTLSLTATAAAAAISYAWLDRPIALFFHKAMPRPESFAKFTAAPNPAVTIAVLVFVALGLMSLSGRALTRLQKCALLCSLSLAVAEMTKAQLKFVFGRSWPTTWVNDNPSFLRDGVYGFNFFHGSEGYASFPSGHMAAGCAVMAVLWFYYPGWRALYVIGTLAAGIGLVVTNYHFLSDVIAGSFVGVSSGWMVTSLWKTHEHFSPPRPRS